MTIGVTWLWYLQGKLPDDEEAGQGQHTRTASLLRYLPHLEQMRNCSLHPQLNAANREMHAMLIRRQKRPKGQ